MPPKPLIDVFNKVVKLWNDGHYIEVATHFYPEKFVMKKINDPGSVVSGLDDLYHYMNIVQAPQRPQFNPTATATATVWKPTFGQVSGTGDYQDDIRVPRTVRIRYCFSFTRSSDVEEWLLINAFAAQEP